MKGIRHNKLLRLISVIVLSCNVQSASAQARISASAVFANGQTNTYNTAFATQTNFAATGNTVIQTITTPTSVLATSVTGPITTVSAESSLPSGFYYAGTIVALPAYGTVSVNNVNSVVVSSLSLGAGTITAVGTGASFTQAAAQILLTVANGTSPLLTTAGGVDAAAALIKAGAGVTGLE